MSKPNKKNALKTVTRYRHYLAVGMGVFLLLLSGVIGSPKKRDLNYSGQNNGSNKSPTIVYEEGLKANSPDRVGNKFNLMSREGILNHKGKSIDIGYGIKVEGEDLEELKLALLAPMGLGDWSLYDIPIVKNGRIQPVSKKNAALISRRIYAVKAKQVKQNKKPEPKVIESTIPRYISFSNLLFNNGIPHDQIIKMAVSARSLFNMDRIKAGQPYKLGLNAGQRFEFFQYDIDLEKYLVIKPYGHSFRSELKKIPYEIKTKIIKGTIHSNLINAITRAGVKYSTALRFVKIFSWKVDFFRDIRKGDWFKVLLERKYRDGKYIKDGKILAAVLRANGKLFDAI